MITLEVLQGQTTGAVFQLEGPAISIGRAGRNSVACPDVHLSDEHGQIFREDDQYIYQDLGSTFGSRLRRGGVELSLDGAGTALRDHDQILLGHSSAPVVLQVRLPDQPAEVEVLARRAISDLPTAAAEVERDPALWRGLYEVSKKLARSGLDLAAVLDGIAEAVFDLVPLASHMSIDLTDDDGKFNTVYARARDGQRGAGELVRTSRTVIRRVKRERAAILVRNATELSSEASEVTSAMHIQSVVAVPLWEGDTIRGVIQADKRGLKAVLSERSLDQLLVLGAQATLAIENARLVQRLRLAAEKAGGENKFLKTREEKRRVPDIIGTSAAMEEIFQQVNKVKDTRATVCIEGETGTGKELIASAIHYQGNRRDKLFIAQNCAAVPENLLESELFGHKKGAFTGADQDKKGLFEIADGGTLFLDEIGETSLGLQAKLLRVLQEGEVRPVGATATKKIDVRIICATNRSLEKEVERGAFRQDLYYRLKVFPLRLPSLRERREDVPPLVEHFLRKYTGEMKKAVAGVTPEAFDQLSAYAWPGNIRELENEVQRLVIQVDPEGFITPDLLSPQIRKVEGLLGRIAPKKGELKDMMEEVERWLLAEALRDHGGNKTRTAETLGITREGLHKKLSKYGM
ncbi:MAG: FHA domain-containing protein [Myxococcales bacterium]|nr:FHA domain-containing protein [Myxococcales bacterium]